MTSKTAPLTATQAIRKVLEEADQPLKAGEIGDLVVPMVPGLKGKTPKATVAAKLYTEAKKPDAWVGKVNGGFVLIVREVDKAPPTDGPAVIPGTKVLKQGEAKPDPKPKRGDNLRRKAKATT